MPSSDLSPAPSLRDFSSQSLYPMLERSLVEDTLAHANLITGPDGIGKKTLARCLTEWLLCACEDDAEKPCGRCFSCIQVREGVHPDVLTLAAGQPIAESVKEGRTTIPVDDIREMIRRLSQHTYEGGRRVVRIFEAERMQPAAQNALLKTLEEPPEGTVFLLTCASPELLLPTIRSRCRLLRLHAWPESYIEKTLRRGGAPEDRLSSAVRLSGGSIGRALALSADEAYWQLRDRVIRDFFSLDEHGRIIEISGGLKDLKGDAAEELLDTAEDMIRMLLLVRLGRLDSSQLSAFPPAWQRMAEQAPLESFSALMDALSDARAMRQSNVTWQAVIERFLFRMMEEKRKWST